MRSFMGVPAMVMTIMVVVMLVPASGNKYTRGNS